MGIVQQQLGNAFAQIGAIFGGPYVQYRPTSQSDPVVTPFGAVTAAFDTTGMLKFRIPPNFGDPKFFAAVSPDVVAVGDYLIGAMGTFFVTGADPNKPPSCILCNGRISMLRPDADGAGGIGLLSPGGQTPGTDDPLITGWPASILIKTRGEAGQALLPGDSKLALFEVLLPVLPGVVLRTSDIATDDLGRRFTISAAELSPLGWRLYAQLSVA